MKKVSAILLIFFVLYGCIRLYAKNPELAPSVAWTVLPPLGLHEPSTIDTLLYNYYQQAIPSEVSVAYATTGNTASPGYNLIAIDRKGTSDFFFRDALKAWIPSLSTQKFYNTRIPMTLLSYNFGGGKENGQERLKLDFSGNANKQWQVGAMLDYIYSKGSYNYQAAKDLAWGASASYMGDRYEMQTFFYHYNNLNMENGGITNDLYITDPAELQGGSSSIDAKSIPTRLDATRSRVKGTHFFLNNRYKLGFWHEEPVPDDTVVNRTYIPVTSFIHTLDFRDGAHRFNNGNVRQAQEFWKHTYFTADGTEDLTKYWSLSNTLGVALLEGFHKYAKFGLAAFATYEIRRYNQTPYQYSPEPLADGLDPFPYPHAIDPKGTQNLLWVGGQLTKQKGKILTYEATGKLGIIGDVAGDVDINGKISTRIPLLGDSIAITGYGAFRNEAAPYLLNHYVSNHFIWENDFGKERTVEFGGKIFIPRTGTFVDVGAKNLQNLIYFNKECMPVQHGSNVQVFSASLHQNLHAGILHWNNSITYQTSSEASVVPLPKLAIYSNLYLLFKVAGVLHVQMGLDCDYYTRYKSVSYQPATMTFFNQDEIEVGNYPFMNFYVNMKLSKARFYIMFSHVNQGLCGKNYFSMPHYPLNPRRFQLGVSVDFAN